MISSKDNDAKSKTRKDSLWVAKFSAFAPLREK